MRVLSVAFVLALAASAGAAAAQGAASSLTLQGAGAPAYVVIDGVAWSCQGAACTAGASGMAQSAQGVCRRVVQRLGPVSTFTWQGQTLSPEQVAACNAAGRR